MRSFRENPDGPENTGATKQIEREIFALKMQAKQNGECCDVTYSGLKSGACKTDKEKSLPDLHTKGLITAFGSVTRACPKIEL